MGESPTHARPRLLIALTAFFLLLAPANYFVRAHLALAPLGDFARVVDTRDLLGAIALFFPLAVGLGLLLARAWGFWLFIVYAPTLIAFNVRSYVERPFLFNAGVLVESALAVALVGYFLQRDIYKPLLSATARGFRRKPRWNIAADISVDGAALTTRDFGENGCYVHWPTPRPVGESLKIELELGGRRFAFAGEIARVDGGGAGIQFRGLSDAEARALKGAIRAAAPRRETPLVRNLAAVAAVLVVGAGAGVLLQRGHPRRPVLVVPPPSGPSPCDLAFARLPWKSAPPNLQTFMNRCSALSADDQRCLQPEAATQPACNAVRDRLMRP